ncbi:hypothetical protein DH2020_036341 [Rehmannia glutinosa]|uniref:Endoglucanase n=1 Tax=Rehmannia glutinosa TaxID=99300 RepID=A0ABR0V441_REHGL
MAGHDYGQALTKSILFFEAQRSGYLPSNQRVQWRGNSGLSDGKISGVDLVGGYYDAGDNVKFGLPMAFTITMMSWSIIEYGGQIGNSGELENALDAVKWGTDYLIKAHPQPYVLYGEVGDGNTDHYCWQRPEDMTTSRAAYKIDPSHPGSDLAGETAAAMAAASIVFRQYDPSYSAELLKHASQLFEFADKYRGKYDGSITIAQKVQVYNGEALGGTGWAMTEFGWDVKYPGVQTLVAKFLMAGKGGKYTPVFEKYQEKAEFFMCSCLGKGTSNAKNSRRAHFQTKVDYILGDNPRATSYMVGYGKTYPQQVHHRGSSIVSYKVDPSFVSCRGGYATWFNREASDPNLLTGAIVGGPDGYDNFADQRDNYEQTEPATYNNAPLVGILARLHSGHSGYNQLLPVELPGVKPVAANPKPAEKGGESGFRYSTTVSNKSTKKLKNLKLYISKLYGPLWGLTKSGDYYFFPAWIHSLAAGKSIEFVYIHSVLKQRSQYQATLLYR